METHSPARLPCQVTNDNQLETFHDLQSSGAAKSAMEQGSPGETSYYRQIAFKDSPCHHATHGITAVFNYTGVK